LKQQGFTLLEMIISLALSMLIGLSIFQLTKINKQRYEVFQVIEELNQKETLLRNILEKTIQKIGGNIPNYVMNDVNQQWAFAITRNNVISGLNTQIPNDIKGTALAINYDYGNRCDGKPLDTSATLTIDYYFVKEDTTAEKVSSLYCKAPNKRIVPLINNVDYMKIYYHHTDASGKIRILDEDLLNVTNWFDIYKIDVFMIISSNSGHYEDAPSKTFLTGANEFPGDVVIENINKPYDGKFRKAIYFSFNIKK